MKISEVIYLKVLSEWSISIKMMLLVAVNRKLFESKIILYGCMVDCTDCSSSSFLHPTSSFVFPCQQNPHTAIETENA